MILWCIASVTGDAYATPRLMLFAPQQLDTVVSVDTVAWKPSVDLAAIEASIDKPMCSLTPEMLVPTVFDRYHYVDSAALFSTPRMNVAYPALTQWLDDERSHDRVTRSVRQGYLLENPAHARYIGPELPHAPAYSPVVLDPKTHKLPTRSVSSEFMKGYIPPTNIRFRHWIHTFESSLQFSQSYISPNWYQGGTGNVNAIGAAGFTIQLNQALHPKLMFETSVNYRLSVNNAPDDSIHAYNISEDLFRINSKFGVKAFDKWYYSVTFQFKTQFLNSYKKNVHDMAAAFLSPGEMNVGVGMTYNFTNKPKTVTVDASLSPLSYNLKTDVNSRVDPVQFGIKAGHKSVSEIGSSGECKFKWKLSGNITYDSRIYLFTNYSYLQGDWENKFSFEINRFLSAQVFAHLRYDSSTARVAGSDWHHWQVKEVLSIGFNYRFSNDNK